MNKQKNIFKDRFLVPPGALINKKIYKFLIALMGNIFLKPKDQNSKVEEFLKNSWIEMLNKKYIVKEEKYISTEYSNDNFKNILDFVKSQNMVLAGDILEGILILIFSYAFKKEKNRSLSEFIYKNYYEDIKYEFKLENQDNYDLVKFFQKEKFKPEELKKIENILSSENIAVRESDREKLKKKYPLYYLLYEIQKLKYINIKDKNKNRKIDKYIYRSNFQIKKIIDINFSKNFIQTKPIRYFLISVFIYYENKYSPLMKYTIEDIKEEIKEEKEKEGDENEENEKIELAVIPYDYNLKEAEFENRLANSVMAPTRLEPRINKITMTQNKLEDRGLFELSKALLFNKNIKKCYIERAIIKSNDLEYLNLGLGRYDNYTLEELNLSNNIMTKDSSENLSKIISHLKNLKTINLSYNDVLKNISSFFIMLNKLYRQKKTKLENLILNKCNLDNSSFYELGELLKSKYCKLKRLYLNNNIIPPNANFFKKLKKNKNLTQIYLNKTNFNEDNTNDIMRIISNTNIETLYLFKTKITDFNDCLRILYRTELIHDFDDDHPIKGQDSFLMNLNLSQNHFFNKNADQIEFLSKFINKTTLYCFDLSQILYGISPDKYEKTQDNEYYRNIVDSLQKKLDDEKELYEVYIDNKNCTEVDIKDGESFINEFKKNLKEKGFNEENFKILENLDVDIIVNDQRAKFPLFLREKSKEIIAGIVKKNLEIDTDFCDFIKEKLLNKNNNTVNMETYKNLENLLLYIMFVKSKKIDYKNLQEKKKIQKLFII